MKNHHWVVTLVLIGCGVEPLEEVAAPLGPSDDCDLLNCPGNSNLLGVLAPYELDETGVKFSSRGLRISGMWRNGEPIAVFRVDGTSPRAATATYTYKETALIGLKLRLEHENGKFFDLRIAGYLSGKVPYYTGGSEIEGYRILYEDTEQPGKERELCPYASHFDGTVEGTYAVFWKGDRYDPETGEIWASNEAVGPWFNISCAGEATIKMLRTRTGGAVAPESSVKQRQATLNMFTASYCGPRGPLLTTDNQPFTKLGQALTWNDLSGPNEIGTVWTYEAVWDERGAVCLTQPRMVDRATIDCGRKIKSCGTSEMADKIANWASYGWLLSANPPPEP
ncbi:MAG TPA: ADYC domain-containing protein [Kofleriaceae bacterium]|nr:ADYC domain-containing protein [Kofleriaceae bacterium]